MSVEAGVRKSVEGCSDAGLVEAALVCARALDGAATPNQKSLLLRELRGLLRDVREVVEAHRVEADPFADLVTTLEGTVGSSGRRRPEPGEC